MQDAISEVLNVHPQLRMKVYVDDINLHVCMEVGVGISDSVEMPGHDFRTGARRSGEWDKARRKNLKQRINIKENESLSKTVHEDRSKKSLKMDGFFLEGDGAVKRWVFFLRSD